MNARRKDRGRREAAAELPAAPRWQPAIIAAAIFAIVFIVFYPSLGNSFNYDDDRNIIDNRDYRGLGLANLRWMFTTFHMGHYQPLSWMTLGLDYLLWGMNPWGYHLTNLLLHAANAVLVFFLSLRFFDLAAAKNSMSSSAPSAPRRETSFLQWAAAIAALLFALHPLRVESVAWVTERRDVLSSFFLLVTILLYLRCQATGPLPRRRRLYLAALFFYLLSLLSRAMGVTLPVILLIIDIYPLKRFVGTRGRLFGREVRVVWLEKIPFAVLALAAAVVAPMAQRQGGATIDLDKHSIAGRCAQACYGLVFYLYKSLLPSNLSPIYELRLPLNIQAARYVASFLAVIVLTVLVVMIRKRAPALAGAAACYVILLLPVLGFVQSGPQEVADRYSYLPSIGWAILIGGLVSTLWYSRRTPRPALAGILLLVLATLSVLTWRQNLVWRSPLSLWTHATQVGPPTATADYNLACSLAKSGERQKALEHFQKSLAVNPTMIPTRYNFANCLSEMGRLDDACREYRGILQQDPTFARAHYELGRVYGEQGRFQEAKVEYREAIRCDKDLAKAYINLGAILADVDKNYIEAIGVYTQALAIAPDHRDGHYNLAIALDAAGKFDEAISHYRRAMSIDPTFPDPHINLGNIFVRQGRTREALAEYQAALRIAPNHPDAKANLEGLTRSLRKTP